MQRRQFLNKAALVAGAGLMPLPVLSVSALPSPSIKPEPEKDEEYWNEVRKLFDVQDRFINLENGYFSPQPFSTLKFHQLREVYVNKNTSWFMRREQEKAIEDARTALSAFLGCDSEELAITRNTTEALNTLIMGFPWKKGDEVVIGDQDYGSMNEAFQQVAARYGVKIKVAKVPVLPETDEQVVNAYLSLCSKKTRLVHITHLINLSGQVVPVAAISNAVKRQFPQILTASDSAHAVAHINFKITDLQVDFAAASLHKWLCNPLGVGFLWMKKVHIPKIWPLMGDTGLPKENIRRFEHQGTRPIQSIETLPEAIRFHQAIGSELKEKRLRYLMQYWVQQIAGIEGLEILTPWKNDKRCGAIANLSVKGYTPNELAAFLLEKHNIFSVAIQHPVINGVRITPHLFTSLDELNALVKAVKSAVK